MVRFNALFKKHVKDTDYKYNPNRTLSWNEVHLKHLAFLENTCRTIYSKIDSTFGEDYAEHITSKVLDGTFEITQLHKYPLKEYLYCEDRVLVGQYIGKTHMQSINEHNLLSYFTGVFREILQAFRNNASIELYDFFIGLAIMLEKWKRTMYPKMLATKEDKEMFIKQVVKHIVHTFYTLECEAPNITLAILDRTIFNDLIRSDVYTYTVTLSPKTQEKLTVTYDMYLEALRIFFRTIEDTSNCRSVVQPKIRTYAYASNKVMAEVFELIEKESGVDIGVVYDVFRCISVDAEMDALFSSQFARSLTRLEKYAKKNKKFNAKVTLRKIREIYGTDYKVYLNVVDKQLAYFLKTHELEKHVANYETIFYKKNYDVFSNLHRRIISEVTIDYEKLMEGCESSEDATNRLYTAILDAQTINQMRVQLLDFPTASHLTKGILNVKLKNISEEEQAEMYSTMYSATQYLISTYNLPFTFELTRKMVFRDKTRACYLRY